jgi:CTP:molybdopterin cytidylyltransferase MocA
MYLSIHRILTSVPHLAAAVLAAGAGTRMGRPKADVPIDGVRLLDRAVAVLREAGCAPVFAVVREGTAVTDAVAVVNPAPGRGMRSSLELAVQAAEGCDALAVVLVDMPGVGADAIRTVTERWRPGRIAVARYGGRRGHPIVMAPVLWQQALELAGPDEGARVFMKRGPELVDEIDVAGDPGDLDTPADLDGWTAR